MDITWRYVKQLDDPKIIKDFLANNNIVLPAELVEIMEKYNGGRPSENSIVTETKREYVFKSLLSYNNNDKETIYSFYLDIFKEKEWFPFATDAAGNFLCYDLKNNKYVLYNHETNQGELIIEMMGEKCNHAL